MSNDSRVFLELPADERSRVARKKIAEIAKKRGIEPKLLTLIELEGVIQKLGANPDAGAKVVAEAKGGGE